MKSIKRAFLTVLSVLLLLSAFMLTSCGDDPILKEPLRRLDVPGGLRVEDGFFVWNPVEYSSRYLISIDGNEYYAEENRYSVNNISDGEHVFKVRAMGDGIIYESSDYSAELRSSFLDGNKTESGYYSEFDDLTKNESFLGYGFDVIRSSVFSDKYIIMSNPIFKTEELMNQRLLKVDSKVTYVDEIESSSIEEFMEDWNVSANVNVSWGKKKIGGSVDVETAFSGSSESTASSYFHCLTFNNQKFYIVLQSDMDSYRSMLSEGFKKDLYSDMEPSRLFELYGTHFITSAVMGGRINSYYLYTSDEQVDFTDISAKVSVDVRYLAGKTNVGVEGGYHSYANSQNINVKNTFEVVGGGDFGMYSDADIAAHYANWEKSLDSHASLIGIKDSGSLRAVWELIDPALDTNIYTWDYERVDPETKEVIHIQGEGSRAAQLEAFFYAYGLDSYNDLMKAAELPEIKVAESIGDIRVDNNGADARGEYKVLSGKTTHIQFNIYPADATNVRKSISLAEEYSFARINSKKELVIDYDVPNGTVIEVILSAGPVNERIKLRITKTSIVEFVTNWDGYSIEPETNVEYGWQISEPELKERPGYNFVGWYTAFDFKETSLYKFGESPIIEDIVLYAKWEKYYPTVSFVTGLDGYYIEPVKTVYGLPYTPDFIPSFEGYSFEGYYESEDLEAAFDFSKPITYNTTVYLDWSLIEYSVKFVADGITIKTCMYTVENKDIAPPDVPTKEGFYGYWENYELITGDVTVVATYTQKRAYTVTFVDRGDVIATRIYNEDNINLFTEPEVPKKEGYTSKWESYTLNYQDITVNCVNDPLEYTIKFNANGGTVNPSTKQVKYDEAYGSLPKPSRTGYIFDGWFTDAESGIKITENTKYTYPQSITLYAHWSAGDVTYTVNHYFMNFATDDYTLVTTEILTGKADSKVSPSTKSKTGFTAPSNQTTTLKFDDSTVVNYYYTRNVYTVYYDSKGGTRVNSKQYYFGETINRNVTPTRVGYTFVSWSGETKMPANDTTLTANWSLITKSSVSFSGSLEISDTDSAISWMRIHDYDWNFDFGALKSAYKYATVTVNLTIKEINDGYQDVYILSNNQTGLGNVYFDDHDLKGADGLLYTKKSIDTAGDKIGTATHTLTITVSSDKIKQYLHIAFGAHGKDEDTYEITQATATIAFHD